MFEQAARAGQVNAQMSLGFAYIQGEGVAQDPARGYAWLDIAARLGFQPAKRARDQLRSTLTTQQRSKAREWVSELSRQLPR